MGELGPATFFQLDKVLHKQLFADCRYVWEALTRIGPYLEQKLVSSVLGIRWLGEPLPRMLAIWEDKIWDEGIELLGGDVTKGTFRIRLGGVETSEAVVLCAGAVLWDERIQLGAGTVVEPGALIKGPTLIGAHTEVRQGAYVRGKCIVGDRCVVGHTTEMKGSVMLDGAKAGHFAYIGDSLLGHDTNLGAGTKLANLKLQGDSVRIRCHDEMIDSGLRKIGAVIGDGTQIGCNAVTNPGTLLGKNCAVFPVASVRAGYYPAGTTV